MEMVDCPHRPIHKRGEFADICHQKGSENI